MTNDLPKYYHLHLVSDSTGETLSTIAKAVTVQYTQMRALEHIHPKVLSSADLLPVTKEIASAPGIVLYTIIDKAVAHELEQSCQKLGLPCIAVLDPIMRSMESYLGLHKTRNVAGQHVLDSDYYKRIDALNFALQHDDGMGLDNLTDAKIVILGATRTSKTPVSIYLANHGLATANLRLSARQALPAELFMAKHAFVAGLAGDAEKILADVSAMHRDLQPNAATDEGADLASDLANIAADIEYTRRSCAEHGWPVIDISGRSIEDTAAEILKLYRDFDEAPRAAAGSYDGTASRR